MPWTVGDPPNVVGDDWTDEEIEACVSAANSVLEDGGSDEEAIQACIGAAGKGERAGRGSQERRIMPAETRVVREDGDSGDPRIEGYAALFEVESLDLGGFREVIHAGAFSQTLEDGADVRGLINHDPSLILGRTKAGTLELREDKNGLAFTLYPPDTSAARDLLMSMERGDVDQMSFGFEAVKDRWETDDRGALRHLLEARLFDVSVVTFPAYPQTSAEARSRAADLVTEGGDQDGDPEGGEELQVRRRRNRARLEIAKRAGK